MLRPCQLLQADRKLLGDVTKQSFTSGPPRFRIRPGIRRALARLNRSQNSIAKECGLSSGYMSQLLTGCRYPGPEVRERLLSAMPEITFDQLFEEVRG